MNAPVLSLALVVSAAPFVLASEVQPGATLEEVRAVLGSPKGVVRAGERHLVYYERGEIEMREERVVRVAMRTEEEQMALAARDERARTEQKTRRDRLVAEGTALRDGKLADAAFTGAPVAYQVAFWEDFARRYPGVPCAEPLTIARLKLNEEVEEKKRKSAEARRRAEWEERLAAAEREPVQYRVRSYPSRYGRRDCEREFALWPVSYTYYDAPLPVYTTPTTPLINPFVGDPAQPERRSYAPGDRDRRGDERRDWRGADRGHGRM